MIWLIVFLCLLMAAQWFFIIRLLVNDGQQQAQIDDFIEVHNQNVQELAHRSEQTQVVKVVEL